MCLNFFFDFEVAAGEEMLITYKAFGLFAYNILLCLLSTTVYLVCFYA